ncbi:MAG: hypothetical protein GTO45_35900 [Candidatus Aminicenantes bacterium]|nr:hypothetical protein [Candidatus Aminicenantes bacterium]NIM84073.1 hypothetical protein [Candidatus Aminicenantes bacterium]NIN23536.1 hypothetical protein [Candidatus Aminicenantes bacterium]NIN47241.1 hypothetical protein [Candidatus Aminicenantes bacterium]NIN90168.1 hypothetical protein [Candidatus Aminicenantes bacterium]
MLKLLNKLKKRLSLVQSKIFYLHPKIQVSQKGDLFLNFGKYGQEIEVACFSPDGSRLLTVKEVNQAIVWDVATQEKIGTIRPTSPLSGTKEGPTTGDFVVFIEAAVLNNSGDTAFLGLNDGTAGLFNVKDGERLSTYHDPNQEPASHWELIKAVEFSNDNSLALVGFFNRSIGIWETKNNSLVAFLRSPRTNQYVGKDQWVRHTLVSSIAISDDNRYVFAGYSDLTADIWDLKTGEVVFSAYEHQAGILSIFQDGFILRWATTSGDIWESINNQVPSKILSTGENWIAVAFSKEDSFLCLTSSYHVKEWYFKGTSRVLSEPGEVMFCAGFAEDIGYLEKHPLYYFPETHNRIVLQSEKERLPIELTGKGYDIITMLVSPKENFFAVHFDENVEIYSLPFADKISKILPPYSGKPLAFSNDEKYLVFCPENEIHKNSLLFWHIKQERIAFKIDNHNRPIQGIVFSPSSKRIISFDIGLAYLWEYNETSDSLLSLLSQQEISANDLEDIIFISEHQMILIKKQTLELWKDIKHLEWTVRIPYCFERQYFLSGNTNQLFIAYPFHRIVAFNLNDGCILRFHKGNFPRPQVFGHGLRWEGPGGPYLHIGEGPRGWQVPQKISPDKKLTIVQTENGADLITFDDNSKILKHIPFKERMRASCILDDKVLIVNSKGEIITASRKQVSPPKK